MIQLYAEKIVPTIHTLTECQRQHMLSLVCVDRKNRVERIRPREKRDKMLLAGVLLENCIRKYYKELYGSSLNQIDFSYGKAGKPYLKEYPEIHFNMSHSGDWIVIAIGDVPVGIDVEQLQKPKECIRIAERYFHPKEYEDMCKLQEADLPRTFGIYWTMKEAYLKYTGSGLFVPLNTFQVLTEEGRIVEDDKVTLVSVNLAEGYSVAICSQPGVDIQEKFYTNCLLEQCN